MILWELGELVLGPKAVAENVVGGLAGRGAGAGAEMAKRSAAPKDLAHLLAGGRWASALEGDMLGSPWGEIYAYYPGTKEAHAEAQRRREDPLGVYASGRLFRNPIVNEINSKQVRTYYLLLDCRLGLLIHFGAELVKERIANGLSISSLRLCASA